MDLSRREHYCNQLGISQWFARKQLSLGATAESLYVQDLALGPSSDEGSTNDALDIPAPSSSGAALVDISDHGVGAKALLREVAGESEISSEQQAEDKSEQGVVASPQPNVSLRAYRFGEILITSSIARDRPDASERSLAEGIVRAFAGQAIQLEYYGVFEWPLFEQLLVQAHVANAVGPYLSRWWSECYQAKVIQHLHFGEEQPSELALPERKNRVCFRYSLSEMLISPAFKQDCWRKLVELKSAAGVGASGKH